MAFTDISDMRIEQWRDESVRAIIDAIQADSHDAESLMFVLNDSILYRHNVSTEGPELLLVIPRHLRPAILEQLHDAPTAGHLGVSHTYDRVRHRFFWPGLYHTVRRYASSCDLCQCRKRPSLLPAGELHLIEVPSKPFHHVGLDLLGPFPTTTLGNKWIAVATDYATRPTITKAMLTSSATDSSVTILSTTSALQVLPCPWK